MTLSAKQRLFAEAVANGENLEAAHKAAGYSGNRANACRLAKKEKIATAVQEIQEKAAKSAEIDKQWLLDRAKRVYDRAMQLDKLSAANAALGTIAKACGLFNETPENEGDKAQVILYWPHNGRDLPRPTS